MQQVYYLEILPVYERQFFCVTECTIYKCRPFSEVQFLWHIYGAACPDCADSSSLAHLAGWNANAAADARTGERKINGWRF
jgi:hypothetical protein